MTLEELWRAPGDDVAVVAGTARHEPGDVRVSFLVVDAAGQVVTLPEARVWVARSLDAKPFLELTAKLERIGVPGGAEADATHIYVAHVRLPRPGTYWLLAEPDGGKKVQALGNVVVAQSDAEPDIGDPAPASDTPTLASVGGDASKVTTRVPPDESLLQYSVAGSLRDKAPFVVTFSTPKFCASRTCGPVVDVVEETARRFEGGDVRFIHVEVYEDNDPAKGYNRWVEEWGLETEPWTFAVDRDGTIVDRFEGAVSVHELERTVREKLADGA
jgi:urease beta subunit